MGKKYRIFYDTPRGVKDYTICAMNLAMAKRTLKRFKEIYLNEDGTGKMYPNGKGFYDVSNPRIVEV